MKPMTEAEKAERRAKMAERKALRGAQQKERDAQRKQDEALVLDAMRAVLQDPEATSAQRIYAVAVLENMQYYHFVPHDVRHLLQTADAEKIDAEVRERLEHIKSK